MAESARLTACLACGSGGLVEVLNLGHQTLANWLPEAAQDAESAQRFPLGLQACPVCGHGQLTHTVSSYLLFGSGPYLYASGTSRTLRAYFRWFARGLAGYLPTGSRVLDLACNDGSMMQALADAGLRPTGIEPDYALSCKASAFGPTFNDFWPMDLNNPPPGQFPAVLAFNVLAHVPDPLAFLIAIHAALSPGGVAFVQTSQAGMLASGQFDCIYHEHYSYFTVASMQTLAARAGLALKAAKAVEIHGQSLVFVLGRAEDPEPAYPGFLLTQPWASWAAYPWEKVEAAAYEKFRQDAQDRIDNIRILLDADSRPLVFLGWAAKASVVCQAVGRMPDVILDEAPAKIGRWAVGPASRLPVQVQPLAVLADLPGRPTVVISAWNFRAELEAKALAARAGRPMDLAVYFPAGIEVWPAAGS